VYVYYLHRRWDRGLDKVTHSIPEPSGVNFPDSLIYIASPFGLFSFDNFHIICP
jgi:hypothetical protein